MFLKDNMWRAHPKLECINHIFFNKLHYCFLGLSFYSFLQWKNYQVVKTLLLKPRTYLYILFILLSVRCFARTCFLPCAGLEGWGIQAKTGGRAFPFAASNTSPSRWCLWTQWPIAVCFPLYSSAGAITHVALLSEGMNFAFPTHCRAALDMLSHRASKHRCVGALLPCHPKGFEDVVRGEESKQAPSCCFNWLDFM